MVHLKAINKTITAPELARVFRDEIFRLHGLPSNIVSDRDPRFTVLNARCTGLEGNPCVHCLTLVPLALVLLSTQWTQWP
jgi:hypothetical protein